MIYIHLKLICFTINVIHNFPPKSTFMITACININFGVEAKLICILKQCQNRKATGMIRPGDLRILERALTLKMMFIIRFKKLIWT